MNREYLVLFLGKAGGNKAKELLIKLYRNDEESAVIRAYAVNSLAYQNVRKAIPEIKKEIERIETYPFKKRRKNHKIYMYSIAALVKFGDKSSYSRLINAARSNNTAVRRRAIHLLKDLQDKRSIDILKYKMTYDHDKKIRKVAKEALKKMGVPVDDDKKDKK